MFLAGKFFETLIGVRKEPLSELLAKLGVIYLMEPALTVVFITNLVHVWENVMAHLRSEVFRRILIQKVICHLQHPASHVCLCLKLVRTSLEHRKETCTNIANTSLSQVEFFDRHKVLLLTPSSKKLLWF